MRSLSRRFALLLCLVLASAALFPFGAAGQSATPVPTPEIALPPIIIPGFWPDNTGNATIFFPAAAPLPESTCGKAAPISRADTSIEAPLDGAETRPASLTDTDLYLLQVSLPAASCVAFDGHARHDGAIVWYVVSGSITMDIRPIADRPAPVITMGRGSLDATGSAELGAGDWIGVDRLADYSYRTGSEPAVLMMTVLEPRAPIFTGAEPGIIFAADCRAICRGARR